MSLGVKMRLSLRVALITKGLRPKTLEPALCAVSFESCPDYEGIKTPHAFAKDPLALFESCPDYEGIKTLLM